MNGLLTSIMSYAFVALAGVCFISGVAVLTGGKE